MNARVSQLLLPVLVLGVISPAQTTSTKPQISASTQTEAAGGVAAPWDAQKLLSELNARNQELTPLLNELHPQTWVDQKGAPSTYLSQWYTAKQKLQESAASVQRLSTQTENIYLCLDAYFRMEAIETVERSLEEGARAFGTREEADKLQQLIARNYNAREQFRQYLLELTANREQMFQIADREAQRCRGMISREASPGSQKKAAAK